MSKDRGPAAFFDEARASAYDSQFAKLAALREAMHLVTRLALTGLGEEAHILCVGAGTGLEIAALAAANPGWRFMAVEPSPPMLRICRERADALGIAPRCGFYEGYLDRLPPSGAFDAATALLVSHFILDTDERRAFFRAIAGRLRPGGRLVTADLCLDGSAPTSAALFDLWLAAMALNGMTPDAIAGYRTAMAAGVALLAPDEIEAIIASAGFAPPLQICQTILMRTWTARKA